MTIFECVLAVVIPIIAFLLGYARAYIVLQAEYYAQLCDALNKARNDSLAMLNGLHKLRETIETALEDAKR